MNHRFLLPIVTAACAAFAAPALAAAPAEAPKTETYRVEGMVCQGCAQTVTAKLRAIAGVRDVQVDFKQRRATIAYTKAAIGQQKLSQALGSPFKLKADKEKPVAKR